MKAATMWQFKLTAYFSNMKNRSTSSSIEEEQPTLGSVLLGIQDTIPLALAAIPFGIIYGALGQSLGLNVWFVSAISVFVFAGASQFIALSMLSAGASAPIIILTVFMVNLRHSLYSVSLLPFVTRLKQWQRFLMGFTLTDETYAVVINEAARVGQQNSITKFYLGSASLMYINWVIFTVAGFYVGEAFPELNDFGLDVAMVVAFTGIAISQIKMSSHWICAAVATVSGALTYSWPHQTGLLFSAFVAITAGVLFENHRTQSNKSHHETKQGKSS